jgi:parvulin-like peptidyl-prolyl isomerase
MMKCFLACAALMAALAGSALSSDVDYGEILARWDDGEISVEDYVNWWKQMPEGERDTLSTMEQKTEFLNNMIGAEFLLAEADRIGAEKHPDVTEFITRRRFNMLSEILLTQAMSTSPTVDEERVEHIYEQLLTQVNVRRIMVETREEAEGLMDSLAAGVSFEDLAYRYSTDVTGERGGWLGTLRRRDVEEPWVTQIFALQAGEISEPFYTNWGWAIVTVETRAEIEPQDPEAERERIRLQLETTAKFAEQAAYLDSLRMAYDVRVYSDAVMDVCSRYELALARDGERTAVVSHDIDLDFTDEEKADKVASFEGWKFTYEDLVNSILEMPYPTRPVLDDPEVMTSFIGRQVKDSLVVAEAVKLGIDQRPEVRDELDRIKRRRVAVITYRFLTAGASVPEDTLRAFYEANREHFILPAGHDISKLVLMTQSQADSIMVLLQEGGSFEEIARLRSIDPFTAPDGGRVGFLPVGKDAEFDGYLETMEVGETKYFRSLEGHLILRLHARYEERPAAYEDARADIQTNLLRLARDRMLEEWLADQAERRGLETYPEKLEFIELLP